MWPQDRASKRKNISDSCSAYLSLVINTSVLIFFKDFRVPLNVCISYIYYYPQCIFMNHAKLRKASESCAVPSSEDRSHELIIQSWYDNQRNIVSNAIYTLFDVKNSYLLLNKMSWLFISSVIIGIYGRITLNLHNNYSFRHNS